jgi:CheY-like chemotaxis protein
MASRIIVIDDDESMRLLCLKALEGAGHRVSCTGSPTAALAMLDQEPVDLLIVDVMLAPPVLQLRSKPVARPFDNGMRVVQEALAKRPDTPVLFISSHSQMILLSKGVNGNRWPVLRKPFSPTVLRTEVTIRLDAAREKTAAGVGPQTHPRYPIECRVDYTGDHEGHGVTKNLSLGGCLLKTTTPVEVDAHLTLQLALPNDPVPIKIHVAVARWSAPLICGLDFLLIDEHGERLLSEYLKRFMAEQGQP